MRKIPPELREQMAIDPFYKACCGRGYFCFCDGRIEWHHNLIVAGRQLNADWAILPLCQTHHEAANNSILREYLNWIMLNRASDEQLKAVSKAVNYRGMRERLNKIHGVYKIK